jgi:hypothetical protein
MNETADLTLMLGLAAIMLTILGIVAVILWAIF